MDGGEVDNDRRLKVDNDRRLKVGHVKNNSDHLPSDFYVGWRPSASHYKLIIAFNAPGNPHFTERNQSWRSWISGKDTQLVSAETGL